MVDPQNDHCTLVFVDLVYDPVSASASRVKPGELPLEPSTDPVGVLGQG
jgi:hypothetical protein